MKVIHIVHWPKSGIVNLIYNQIVSSNDSSIEYFVIFLIKNSESTDKFLKAGAKATGYNFKYLNFFYYFLLLGKDIVRYGPDVVHTHSFIPRLFVRILALFFKSFKVVSTFHNTYPYLWKNDFKSRVKTTLESKSIVASCCRLIVVSNYVKSFLLKHTTIPSSFIRVIHPGVTLPLKIIPSSVQDDNHVVIVGRLDKQKRHDRLLEIWQKVIKTIPDAHLDIVGDGAEKKSLISQAKQLGIIRNVSFLGFRNDVHKVFQKANFSVLTSAYEGFGLVVVESFLQKKTVICFDTGPLGEIIDSESGILIPPWDLDKFADRIICLLQNKHIAVKLGNKGFEMAMNRFDAKNMAQKIESVYYEVLQ